MPDKNSGANFYIDTQGKLKPEPSDREVDELLELAKSGKFESGIYNYCDRWCEKCLDTERCFLFAQEQKQAPIRAAMKNSEADFSSEVMYNFKLTEKLIKRTMTEQNREFTPEDLAVAEKEEDLDGRRSGFDDKPCLKLAKDYLKSSEQFLKDYEETKQGYERELNLSFNQDDIKDEIETVAWYMTMLATKIWRAIYDRMELEREQDVELKEMMAKDMPKIISLTQKCLDKSSAAICSLAIKRKELADKVLPLLAKLKQVELAFNEEFSLAAKQGREDGTYGENHLKLMSSFEQNPEAGLEKALVYLANNPADRLIYGVIGDMLINLNRSKQGIPFLEFSIIANPDQPVAYYVLGGALAKLGRFNRAKQLMERAWELDGKELEIKRNLGWITAMCGRFKGDNKKIDQGRNILKEIIKQDDSFAVAMVDLAQSYLMMQEFDQALSWITRAKKQDPGDEFVNMIYNDVISMQEKSRNDPNFNDFLGKQKAMSAHSGPKPKDDEEMDEHLAKQFEIEDLINQLNQGSLSQADMVKIMKKIKESGLVGQVTVLPADADPASAAAASEYISYHQQVRDVEKKFSKEETIVLTNELLSGKLKIDKEKEIIIKLAHQGTKQALEALEKYQGKAKGDIAVWVKMAINECRAFFNSSQDGPGMFFNKL